MICKTMIRALAVAVPLASIGCATARHEPSPANHVILVGHGVPPSDYPPQRLREYFRFHSHDPEPGFADAEHERGHAERAVREREIREWPRTPQNDPYKFGVDRLADALRKQTGHKVLVAYNEFCAPTVDQAVDQAVADGADRIIVVTTMMTPGGGHSEKDIPTTLVEARNRHRAVEIVYAWPFDVERVAAALSDQVKTFEASPRHAASLSGR